MMLQKGWGYWDITNYPYGGNFHRLTSNTEVESLGKYPGTKSPETKFRFKDGRVGVITDRAIIQTNPPKGKWIPSTAVKFHKNGMVSVRKRGR
jgi:hypothetical protein